MNYPDIYYMPQWAQANAERDDGVAEHYCYECEHGVIYYPYIKRAIKTKVNGQSYFDTITPYGFNGPVVISATDKEKLLEEFDADFTKYCMDNHLVAEYVRFSPWLKNHLDFCRYYSLKQNNKTLYIDLQKNFFAQEFSSERRNQVRRAQNNGVIVKFDFAGVYIDEFCRLYEQMADKNHISPYYMFSKSFILKVFQALRGHVFIAIAWYNGIPISASMSLYNGERVHGYLSGNDYGYISLGASILMYYEVAKWGQERGIKEFHLGGATNESLYQFKKNFTKEGILDYFVGTRIRNEQIYSELVDLNGRNNSGYFPEYRG